MSFNIENTLAEIQKNLLKQIDEGMENGMEKLKEEAIKLSDDRIYNKPLPSKYAKRTGLYRKSFKISKLDTCKYEISNTTDYGIYVEYKHNYLILNDAVFNNIDKMENEILKVIK